MTDLFDRAAMLARGSRSALRARPRSRFEPEPGLGPGLGGDEPIAMEGDPLASGALDTRPPATVSFATSTDKSISAGIASRDEDRLTAIPRRETRPDAVAGADLETPDTERLTFAPDDRTDQDRAPALTRAVFNSPRAADSHADRRLEHIDRLGSQEPNDAFAPTSASTASLPERNPVGRPESPLSRPVIPREPESQASPPVRSRRPPPDEPEVHRDRGREATVGADTLLPEAKADQDISGGRTRRSERGSSASTGAGEARRPGLFKDPLGVTARARVEGRLSDSAPRPPKAEAPAPIEVTIGRLEIRAGAAPPPRPARAFAPHLDLAAYRSRRERGQ